MHLPSFLSLSATLYLSGTSASILPEAFLTSSHDVSKPSLHRSPPYRIPTVHESAVMARRILSLTPIGTLATIFPPNPAAPSAETISRVPASVANTPIGLMEYIADCPATSPVSPSSSAADVGNPLILAIGLATPFRNVASGSNISLSLRWQPPPYTRAARSSAALPRFSLSGHLEKVSDEEVRKGDVKACYRRMHPDVFWWPGAGIHEAEWVRLVVTELYWFGGFGDRSFIGWIPAEIWKGVTRQEIDQLRLPGEENEGLSWRDWLGLGNNELR